MRLRPVTNAIVEALADAGLAVGLAEKPEGVGWQGAPGQSAFVGYVVVYPMLGGITDGPIGNFNADAWAVYQLTSVGGNEEQCEWVADEARVAMLAARPAGDDWKVAHVVLDVLGGAVREDDVQPSVWYSPERYRVAVTTRST